MDNNSDITFAESKDECQVDTCQTYEVKIMSDWTSKSETSQVDFGSKSRFCSCTYLPFHRKQVLCNLFFLVTGNGYCSCTDISPVHRNNPFIILDEELFQGVNDSSNTTGFTKLAREDMKEHVSSGEREQEDPENISWEVTSSYAPLPLRRSSFKLKKMSYYLT